MYIFYGKGRYGYNYLLPKSNSRSIVKKMSREFLQDLRLLMHIQQRNFQDGQRKSPYSWLLPRESVFCPIPHQDELEILNYLKKVHYEDQRKLLSNVIIWMNHHMGANGEMVLTKCLSLLNYHCNEILLQDVTIRRMDSFRNSLRSLSTRVFTKNIAAIRYNDKPRRSVTFNDNLEIYSISK